MPQNPNEPTRDPNAPPGGGEADRNQPKPESDVERIEREKREREQRDKR